MRRCIRLALAAAIMMAAHLPHASAGARAPNLSPEFRDIFRRVINHITYAEKTQELCDANYPDLRIGEYTNLSAWEEEQRLLGAKAFLSLELARLDPALQRTIAKDGPETRKWLDDLPPDDLHLLCSTFLRRYRAAYLANDDDDQNVRGLYPAFFREAERSFPLYFSREASARWGRMDPVSIFYRELPSGMSWWRGEVVGDGRVIYVQPPAQVGNGSGFLAVVSDFIVLDAGAARQAGALADVDRGTWHAVAPLADGSVFDGEFTTYDTAGVATVFKFTVDGRFQLVADSSVFAIQQTASGARSASDAVTGRYRIAGYALELQPEGGEVVRLNVFPLQSSVFGTGNGDGLAYLNIDGNLYLRNDRR